MNVNRKPARLLTALLIAALSLAFAPAALADSGYKAVVAVESMKVYAEKSPHDYLGSLPKGTEVTVKAEANGAALISLNGKRGIAQASDLTAAASDADSEQGKAVVANRDTRVYKKASTSSSYTSVKSGASMTLLAVKGDCAKVSYNGKTGYVVYSHLSEPGASAQTPSTNDAPAQTGSVSVVTTQSAKVYLSASASADAVTLAKGTALTLLAVKGDWAMVERDGAIGYTAVSALEKASSSQSATKSAANPFSSGTNQHAIYAYLTGELGLNRAATMGVMANIKYESSYNPTCSGDGGTSYGICQWHAGRKTSLINWCNDNGLDYATLDAQLKFLKHELGSGYPSVLSYLKGVENTADGAYDAGYYFCFNYEAPAARTSQSTKRASYAKDTLFAM